MGLKTVIHILFSSAAVWLLIFLCRCSAIFFGYVEEETYTSPEGTNTIIVKYDLVCRPDVFKKESLWDKKIWEYSGSGFMEIVHFDVEWLSENQILLTYDDIKYDEFDEEYIIDIP